MIPVILKFRTHCDVAQGVDVRGAGGYVQGRYCDKVGRYCWDMQYCSPVGKLSKMSPGLLRHCMGANLEDAC